MVSRVAASAAAVAAVLAAFVTLASLGYESAAAAMLLAFPIADLLMRGTAAGRYLARQVGLEPASHLLVALWAIGTAAVAVAANSPSIPVRLALAVAAGAAVTAAVEWVAWARHPRSLAFGDFPGIGAPPRPATAVFARPLGWVAGAAQAVATTALVVGAGDRTITIAIGSVLALYAIRSAAAVLLAVSRAFRGDARLRTAIDDAVTRFRPEVLVHFSGSIRTVYQLDQWMPFVASAGLRVILVLREEETFEAVTGRWPVPSVYIRDFPDLDLIVRPDVRLALYVNTGTKNNHLIRFGSIIHVQMHHGDSDKPVSSSKTMRLYDHHFVAGPAGAERLLSAGVILHPDAVSVVGRPQIRSVPSGALTRAGRSVLYAPTWEGFHVDAPLCSLAAMGELLAREMPADIELIVRPHPLTGSVDRSLHRALVGLRRFLALRGRSGRYVDPATEDLAETFADADVLITDVSSVLVDFLAADRPVIVTDAAGLGEDELHRRYPTTGWAGVLTPNLSNLDSLLEEAFTTDRRHDLRRAAAAEFLGEATSPEAVFHTALRALVDSSSHQADQGSVDS